MFPNGMMKFSVIKRIILTTVSIGTILLLLFLITGNSTPKDLVLRSLCAHGYGKGSTARRPVFSNEVGSFCSSLGHYRVGKEKTMSKPTGRKALLLYGKDKSNSKALQRGILIHPVSLPNFSIYPFLIPVKVHKVLGHKIRPKSEGCITIPFRKYAKVVKTVKSSNKPLMLWVYEGMY